MLISCFDGLGEVSQVRRSLSRSPQSVATPLQGTTSHRITPMIKPMMVAAAAATDGAHTAMVLTDVQWMQTKDEDDADWLTVSNQELVGTIQM